MIDESDLSKPASDVSLRVLFQEPAHHGNAWPAPGCHFIHSVKEEGDSLPADFAVRDQDFNEVQRFEDACVRYHGFSYTSDDVAIAGCGSVDEGAGHVMALSYNSDSNNFALKKLSYPSTSLRTGTLWSYGNMKYAIGNYGSRSTVGYHAVVHVDPTHDSLTANDIMTYPETAWSEAALTKSYSTCALGVMKGSPHHIVAMLPDGRLYVHNSKTFAEVAIVDVFAEKRVNITRANYTCGDDMQTKVELGFNSIFVYKYSSGQMLRFDVTASSVSSPVDTQMPAIGVLGDAIVAIPTVSTSMQCAPSSATTTTTTAAPPNMGASSSDDNDDLKTTVTVLAVLFSIVVVLLVVISFFFAAFVKRAGDYQLLKHDQLAGQAKFNQV